MRKLKLTKDEPTNLEIEIERLFETLKGMDPSAEEYDKVADQLAKLYKLKEVDSKKHVSPDVLVGAATNIGGIILLLNYEHAHVLTSKALGFIRKSIM